MPTLSLPGTIETRSISELIGTIIAPAAYALPAGETLGGHRAIYADSDGKAYYADPSDPTARLTAGVTTGAAVEGDPATVQYNGVIQNAGWAWAADEPIWLGANGSLTQSPPATGHLVLVGVPVGPTQLRISPQSIAFIGD